MNYLENSAFGATPPVGPNELQQVFQLCRSDQWRKVHSLLVKKPWIALTAMIMDNNITTTILHQAITSRGNIHQRAQVIESILACTPRAARLKNGYGSLPLHVIAQRNTKINAQTKERMIYKLVEAYEEALIEEGGPGKRTPLHIIFTDYISPHLTQFMIERGRKACFMRDRKGYLPSHVACSRHCSPEKLRMLLAANPSALYATTKDGHTLLSLATNTATKSHPNYALIDELNFQLESAHVPSVTSEVPSELPSPQGSGRISIASNASSPNVRDVTSYEPERQVHPVTTEPRRSKRKNVVMLDLRRIVPNVDPVDLLLHFSRDGLPELQSSRSLHEPCQTAEV